jgi:dienelactone hydrolase
MIELKAFDYAHDGTALRGQLALPPGEGPHPGVLVMHNAHGLGDQPKERALRLAGAGYAALATDMYGGGRRFSSPEETGPPFAALMQDPRRVRARVVAGFEALRRLPGVDADRIGAIGFCFGGQCVLELARSGAAVRSVVSLHGLLRASAPARPGEVRAKVLAITGARDPFVPHADVEAFQSEMAEAGVDWQLTLYGEGWHAFTDSQADHFAPGRGVRHDPLLDQLSWAQAMAYLDATVRPMAACG